MARLRYNGLVAELGGSGLTNSATSITFAAALTYGGGTSVPTITGSDFIPLSILDSDGVVKEIVYLTAYTTAATTGTIARGKETTSGVSHSAGVGIIHAPTVLDVGTPTYLLAHGSSPASGDPEGIVFWKAPSTTTWDFTAGSLPSGFSAQGTPTSVSFDGTGMTATYDAADAHKAALPITGLSTFIVEAKFVSGSASSTMLGTLATDSSGNGVGSVYYSSPSGLLAARASAWAYGSSFETVSTATTYPAWMRLRMAMAGTAHNYYASRSLDGVTYSAETAVAVTGPTSTVAPTTVAVGSILGTVTAKVEWVKFSGGVGGLQGWWDGSTIVSF